MIRTDEGNGGMSTTMLMQPAGSFGGNVVPYPVYQQGGNGVFGGEQSWWIILLVIILMAAGGWNNGNQQGNNGGQPIIIQEGGPGYGGSGGYAIQRGFDQASIMGGIGEINAGINTLQNGMCSGFASVNAAINGGVNTMQQQMYGMQTSQMQGMNGIQMQIADGNYDQRLGIEGIKATIIQENCADRYEAANNTRDIIDNANRNHQMIIDKLCQLELDGVRSERDAERREAENLRTQLNILAMKETSASQIDALYERFKNCPVPSMPVYGNQPIFTCQSGYNSCGCGA